MNEYKVILFLKDFNKKLNYGKLNVNNINKIILNPYVILELYSLKDNKGDKIIIYNDVGTREVNIQLLINSGVINNINSINILEYQSIEGFGKIAESCHFVCSSLNLKNIILFAAIIYLIVLFINENKN